MGTSRYNLEQLGWYNFEQLIRTLLREIVGAGLSSFSGSVDQGRDATFSGKANSYPSQSDPWCGDWIFQVKHRRYSSQGAAKTRSELKKVIGEETIKITNKHHFSCNNYIFITNCPLTALDKDQMKVTVREVSPKIKEVAILNESDLDELLDSNPKVVSAFPQILGLSQLRELVEWGLHRRSEAFLLAAQREISIFVATTPYLDAVRLLHKQHFCVLSGPPKMGKTCTAYAIAASFSALSFAVYELRTQKDFHDVYRREAKQLFICDDVFGDISLRGSLRDDWSRGLIRLLGSLDKDHKLVWTAREYILQEAIASSKLKEERSSLVTSDKVTVSVDKLSRLEKAMILYNHAKIANLPIKVRDFLKSSLSIAIVDHPNYSPESIRQLCTGRLVDYTEKSSGDSEVILTSVNKFLSQPGESWKMAYRSAPKGEQFLCLEVMASGGAIRLSELKKRYENSFLSPSEILEPFERSFTNAEGTFLRKNPCIYGDDEIIHFYHPSMRDLIVELMEQDKKMRVAFLKQLSLEEVSLIIKPQKSLNRGESAKHRILIDDEEDLDLFKDHLTQTLLPQCDFSDVLVVLKDLIEIQKGGSPRHKPSIHSKVFCIIMDAVVPHACSKTFWEDNENNGITSEWRSLFELLRTFLPFISVSCIPEYVPEILKKHKDDLSVQYWGLVAAAQSILPTIVEQCIDLDDKKICRSGLCEKVKEGLKAAESHDLEFSCDDSQYWHDEYESLLEECEYYDGFFPEDGFTTDFCDFSNIFDDFPRLEQEGEGDKEDDSLRESSSLSPLGLDESILRIFSDL